MMRNLSLRHFINASITLAIAFVLSCSPDVRTNSEVQKDSSLMSDGSEIKSINGLLVFKSDKIFFKYLENVNTISNQERKDIERRYRFTSFSTAFENITNERIVEEGFPNSLISKQKEAYQVKLGAVFLGKVINKSGYFVVGNYLKKVDNQYVKSTKINNSTSEEINKAIEKIDNYTSFESDAKVMVSEIKYKNINIDKTSGSRVYPSLNVPFVVESDRVNPYSSNGYKFSVQGTVYFWSYLTVDSYCDGPVVYDEDCRCDDCKGQMIFGDTRRYTWIATNVQSLVDGSSSNSGSYTSSVSVYGSLNLYHPGESAIPIYVNLGQNGSSLYHTFYESLSSNITNVNSQLEGQLTFGAVFDLSNYLSGRPPFSVSVPMNF